eukprot:10566900-Alexandrium_andersonii.AAC.1
MRRPAPPLHAGRSAPVRRRAPPGMFKKGREREPGGRSDRPAPNRPLGGTACAGGARRPSEGA